MIQKILVANWKMNPQTLSEAKVLVNDIKKISKSSGDTRVVIAPPTIYLGEAQKMLAKSNFSVAAQNVSAEKEGAYTGEISAGMLKDAGMACVIVGHSECRARGESEVEINKKVLAVTALGMTVILCVGERERDDEGYYLEFLKEQIQTGLRGVQVKSIKNIVIAYEPIWAIGKDAKRVVLASELHEMSIFIRKTLLDLYGKAMAYKVPIIYGGSVDAINARDLISNGAVDGFLVGRASLTVKSFSELLLITKSSGSPKSVRI